MKVEIHILRAVYEKPAVNKMNVVLELAEGGELFDFLVGSGRLTEKKAREVCDLLFVDWIEEYFAICTDI